MTKRPVAIVGAAGYAGGELLRLLAGHPHLEVTAAISATFPNQPVHRAHPHLRGTTALTFSADVHPVGLAALFLAGPHGEAMRSLPGILAQAPDLKVVDLSGDFRLRDAALYPTHYGIPHAAPDLLPGFVYGLTEFHRAAITKTARVANPGCFATTIALALAPLAAAGWRQTVAVTAVTGSSGSGASPSATTHHPTRDGNMRAYKPLAHQHVPEVEQFLDGMAGGPSLRIALVPVSGPFVRGIHAVCHLEAPDGWTAATVRALYQDAYGSSRFVRLCDAPPDMKAVVGSNFCDVYTTVRDGRVVVVATLDNLIKGAAGQAVQNLNLMLGFDEAAGLAITGVYP